MASVEILCSVPQLEIQIVSTGLMLQCKKCVHLHLKLFKMKDVVILSFPKILHQWKLHTFQISYSGFLPDHVSLTIDFAILYLLKTQMAEGRHCLLKWYSNNTCYCIWEYPETSGLYVVSLCWLLYKAIKSNTEGLIVIVLKIFNLIGFKY